MYTNSNQNDSFLISTTDSLSGYKIVRYYNMISERVVVGAGWISEFFAGFTDTFGGRSQSIENQLSELYSAAVDQLSKKAKRLGANALLGVKLDIDEISGKGTMMFMVSAIGTPVKVINGADSAPESTDKTTEISYQNLMSKKYEMQLMSSDTLQSYENAVEVFKAAQSSKVIFPYDVVFQYLGSAQYKIYDEVLDYFTLYDAQEFTDELNNFIGKSNLCGDALMQVYETYAIPDYKSMVQTLKNESKKSWAGAFAKVASKPKQNYSSTDADFLKEMCKLLSVAIEPTAPISTGALNRKIWHCRSCGFKNPLSLEPCGCGRGKSGLRYDDELYIKKVIGQLQEIHDILQQFR